MATEKYHKATEFVSDVSLNPAGRQASWVKHRLINTAARPRSPNQFAPIESDQIVSELCAGVSFVNRL